MPVESSIDFRYGFSSFPTIIVEKSEALWIAKGLGGGLSTVGALILLSGVLPLELNHVFGHDAPTTGWLVSLAIF
jgi:hypothetical protein